MDLNDHCLSPCVVPAYWMRKAHTVTTIAVLLMMGTQTVITKSTGIFCALFIS